MPVVFEVSPAIAQLVAAHLSPPIVIGRVEVMPDVAPRGVALERVYIGLCEPHEMVRALRRIEDDLTS